LTISTVRIVRTLLSPSLTGATSDLLDDFAAPAPAPPTSTAPKPTVAGAEPVWGPAGATPAVDDEFAAQLAAGMEALMRELGAPGAPVPGAGGGPAPPQTAAERAQAEKLAAAWEAMLVEGMDAASASGSGAGASAGTDTAATAAPAAGAGTEHEEPADAFQKTIREAMARMQDNEAGLRVRPTRPTSCPPHTHTPTGIASFSRARF
jgi:peroxin-19